MADTKEMEREREASPERFMTLVTKTPKFLFVLSCYTLLAYALHKLIFWFSHVSFNEADAVGLIAWLKCDGCGPTKWEVLKSLLGDILLFGGFIAQHTLMAKRHFKESWFHQKVVEEWKLGKAIYTLTTGLALLIIVSYWSRVPVYIWKNSSNVFVGPVHACMWITLYGAALIQDLPDLVGLDEAVLVDNSTQKSPRFVEMLKEQRHTGLIPFTILTLVTDLMTLDRVVFLLFCTSYCFIMWKQQGTDSYDYVSEMSTSKLHKIYTRVETRPKTT